MDDHFKSIIQVTDTSLLGVPVFGMATISIFEL